MSDPYTDWNAGTLKYTAAYFPAHGRSVSYASQVSERLIDVKERCQPMDIGLNEYLSGFRSGVRCPYTTRIFHRNGSRSVHGKYANFVATKASATKMSPLQ